MRISDWSSDVCSSDLRAEGAAEILGADDHLAVDEAGGGDDADADRTDARELIETPRRNLESPWPLAEALGLDQHKKGGDCADPDRRCNPVHYVAGPTPGARRALGRTAEHTSDPQ